MLASWGEFVLVIEGRETTWQTYAPNASALSIHAESRRIAVGEPSGRYLWMLTRERQPAPATRALIEARVRELGYDWSLVRVTDQRGT